MKRLLTLSFLAMLLFCGNLIAQNLLISVQSGTETTFYTDFQKAIDEADAGSKIVLPARQGDYTLNGPFTISKKLFIYGVGHYPDSTKATGRTIINGNVILLTGADNGSISGIYINGDIKFGNSANNQKVVDYTISRCRMANLELGFSDSTGTKDCTLSENIIIGYVYGHKADNILFIKNIFVTWVGYLYNGIFKNNIFLKQVNMVWIDCGRSERICTNDPVFFNLRFGLFENNIFLFDDYTCWHNDCATGCCYHTNLPNSINNCTFNNNLFTVSYETSFLSWANSTGNSNIFNQSISDIFENSPSYNFDYKFNYKLSTTSSGKGAGTDGYDIGIYGSKTPYKEGAVPVIPHFLKQSIEPTEVTNGKLEINVKVQAQTK